jgi:hypothetical protein
VPGGVRGEYYCAAGDRSTAALADSKVLCEVTSYLAFHVKYVDMLPLLNLQVVACTACTAV